MAERRSSSLASSSESMKSVLGLPPLTSKPHFWYTSKTLPWRLDRSWSWCSSVVPLDIWIRLESSSDLLSSSRIWDWRASMFSRSEEDLRFISRCVEWNSCLSSSRACSVSWEFWMRKRFCSSSCVKISRSCRGSVKNMSMSCPLEVRGSASTSGFGGIRGGFAWETAWRAAFLDLPCFTRASKSASMRASHSFRVRSFSICQSSSRRWMRSSRLCCCRCRLRCRCSSKNSGGVNESRKSLYFRQSSRASLCLDISLWTIWMAWFSFLIS
mmetsp:Transcript_1878/g.5543  ORF Transcript_1878/g.5543 Transcript_1878/m.5543 type:complete len:270 (+) Transcript_1878:303-1112(+)